MSFDDVVRHFAAFDVCHYNSSGQVPWSLKTVNDSFTEASRTTALVYCLAAATPTWAFLSLIQPHARGDDAAQRGDSASPRAVPRYVDVGGFVVKADPQSPLDPVSHRIVAWAMPLPQRIVMLEMLLEPGAAYLVVPVSLTGGPQTRFTFTTWSPKELEVTTHDLPTMELAARIATAAMLDAAVVRGTKGQEWDEAGSLPSGMRFIRARNAYGVWCLAVNDTASSVRVAVDATKSVGLRSSRGALASID
eukprot:gene1995-19966_t